MQGENYEFDVDIRKIPDLDGAYVEIPFDVKAAFGRRHVKVHATFDGVAYDGQIVRWGMPRPILRVRKEIRKQIRKQPGDLVHVTITARQIPENEKIRRKIKSRAVKTKSVLLPGSQNIRVLF